MFVSFSQKLRRLRQRISATFCAPRLWVQPSAYEAAVKLLSTFDRRADLGRSNADLGHHCRAG
jgi:hypothetical protein